MSNAERCRRYQDRRKDHVDMIGRKVDAIADHVNTLFERFQQLMDHVNMVLRAQESFLPNGSPERKVSPDPSKETTPSLTHPSEKPFSAWWECYPEKVGKGAARKAFAKALTKTSLDQLIAGVERYKATKPLDRSWCNPATWLNQERWLDVPAVNNGAMNGHAKRLSPAEKLFLGFAQAAEGDFGADSEASQPLLDG